MKTKWLMVAVAACLVLGGIASVSAQDFPTRPIHIIVPLTPGSGADIAGRIVSKYMTAGTGAARGGREPSRRRRADRHGGGDQVAGGRLHPDGAVGLARGEFGDLQEPAV